MKKVKININTKLISKLTYILKQERYNDKLCKDYLKSIAVKGIFFHDRLLYRESSCKAFKTELKNALNKNKYKEQYNLLYIKENILKIEELVSYINKHESKIEIEIIERLSEFITLESFKKVNILLYAGGVDYGFCLIPRNIYLNVSYYANNLSGLISTLAHETYHARERNVFKYLMSCYANISPQKRYTLIVLREVFEEGIASLIEYGLSYDYNSNSIITPEDLIESRKYFNRLNDILEIIIRNTSAKCIREHIEKYRKIRGKTSYVAGYIIAKDVYLKAGIKGLDIWSKRFDFKTFIQTYIIACKKNNKETGFTPEVENWLLSK